MATEANVGSELQAWREAHEHLSKAVLVAKEAVEVATTQRRYWLEEVCANLTPDGKLANTSVWKKTTKTTRKAPAKRKSTEKPSSTKRKRKAETKGQDAKQNPSKKGKRKKDAPRSTRVKLKVPKVETAVLPNDSMGMSMTQMYGDQQGIEQKRPIMSPMQVTQQGDDTQASSFHSHQSSFPYPSRGKVLPQSQGKVLLPTYAMPYTAAQQSPSPTEHDSPIMSNVPAAPSARPIGAYASVLQGGDDSDTASEDEDE